MAQAKKPLLPPVATLNALSPQKVKLVIDAINQEGERSLRYASLSMICGTGSLIAALSAFVVLVQTNHEKAAGVVLGTTVVGVIAKIIASRL